MKMILVWAALLAAGQLPAWAQLPVIPLPAEVRGAESDKSRQCLPTPATTHVQILPAEQAQLGAEGYRLEVTAEAVHITAATEAGAFYGRQTALQLALAPGGRVPLLTITDQPRYAWRGYLLDVSRHFAPPAELKALLDEMARYKLNRFHWHLTDDEGWRIEIKKYPLLTSLGGVGDKSNPQAPAQFYTQSDIRDLVAYARARHIVIVPEIDMPGHASGATRAYPAHAGGGSDRLPNFTFNPGKPETLRFLQDILREVKELFPDCGVIHYGGDEVHFGWGKWDTLPEVQALKAQEHLADKQAVEKWFNRTMAAFINTLGCDTGGWDEILDAGTAPAHTVIFWWRHDKPAQLQQALQGGFKVVLCPRHPCYFDFLQSPAHKIGRHWNGINELQRVYGFPETSTLPADLAARAAVSPQVLGMQACLWTETCASRARREFLTFPRLLALAESAWTPAAQKNYASFAERLKIHLPQLQQRGINCYDPFANSPEVVDQPANATYIDHPESKPKIEQK